MNTQPVQSFWNNHLKLAAAKKLGRRRANNKWHREKRDELTVLTERTNERNRYRKAHGIPLDAPLNLRGRKAKELSV